ncbi:GNAT family N-acetyltransferase [Labedaea rhizosphaerae]|uniref:Mycothiol synthase n=1 Tax=Labedaea rhizosphaerae TaxID=598644 RepID=A0A4R6SBA0_LABRH|nr:GNAT family N-acetyltransferase [Labedaea rhizosphaerae]TDP97319.1 mycothiol synthase [Labedaea rhizosphaerae]
MTEQWRPLTEADAKEWVRLVQAAEAVDRTGEHADADDFAELAHSARMDLATGSVGVFRGDELVAGGVAWIEPGARGPHRVSLDGVVHPDARRAGLGHRLLTELERLGHARHAATVPGLPLVLTVLCHDGNPGKAVMLAAAGYAPQRWFFDMRRELTDEPAAVPVPDGVRLVPYPVDDEPVRVAFNEFFAEHWGHADATAAAWHHTTHGHAARPDLSFLLHDQAGEIAAFVISHYFPADHEQSGVKELWIPHVGTRKSLRGKGLATALLVHAMRAARAAGFERAALSVDADNATGALGVYERVGFGVTSRWTSYGKRPER